MRRVFAVVAIAASACGGSEPTPLPCTYTSAISPASFAAAGGPGAVTVTTASTCAWSATANSPWISITGGASGSGNGTVTFSIAANAEPSARSGSLTVANQAHTVQQEAAAVACSYAISPPSAAFGKDGGSGSVSVASAASCAWTATSEASAWLTIGEGRSGTGAGNVSYSVARNDATVGRSGTLRIAGQPFTVSQSGDPGACTYAVSPVEFTPCMATREFESQVTTQAGCAWTAATDASWITIASGASGSGSGAVRFRIPDNWDAPRLGVIMVRWPTPTAGQNVRVAQAGCHYAVSRETMNFGAAGGSGTFDVLQQSEPYTCGGPLQNACVWSATADVAWIVVSGAMPRTGDDRVTFTVLANGGPTRTGRIIVRNKVVTITQSGA